MKFGAGWSQVEVETGTDWLAVEEKTGEDQLMVLEESEAQTPQLLMAGRGILWQEPVDWENYLPHSELLLQVTENHLDQMMMGKPL